jgi:tripartite-type tricarboxylate transporter receptor subunit TctC
MDFDRRTFVAGAAGLAGSALLPGIARAASFPNRDITFMIPYGPGGGFDDYVRAVMPAMQSRVPKGVNVLPTNVEGAGGARAANQIYRAKPDGYTISIINVPGIIILKAQGGLNYDPLELSWLCNMGRDAYAIVVPAKSPLKTVADLRALSKKRPLKFTGVGPAGTSYSATKISAELLDFDAKIITGYKGTNDQLVAMIRGDGDCSLVPLTTIAQFQDGGLVRPIVTFEEHSSVPGAEDATTLKQPDLAKIGILRPVAAPPKLPAAERQYLSKLLIDAMNDPRTVAWAKTNRANLKPDDTEATNRLFQGQVEFLAKWKKFLT